MRFLAVVAGLFLASITPVFAACSAGMLTQVAAVQAKAAQYTPPTYTGPAPIVIAGDSHAWFPQTLYPCPTCSTPPTNALYIDGHPVIWAGIQGVTFNDLTSCFPTAAIAATNPYAIGLFMGYNDAANNVCCNPDGSLNAQQISDMATVFSVLRGLSAKRVWMSDPPQIYAASAPLPLYVYSMAAAMRASAGSEPFVDFYTLTPGAVCNSPIPYCYGTGYRDTVHPKDNTYRVMVDMIMTMIKN